MNVLLIVDGGALQKDPLLVKVDTAQDKWFENELEKAGHAVLVLNLFEVFYSEKFDDPYESEHGKPAVIVCDPRLAQFGYKFFGKRHNTPIWFCVWPDGYKPPTDNYREFRSIPSLIRALKELENPK